MFYCYIMKFRDYYYVGITEDYQSRMKSHYSHCWNEENDNYNKKFYRVIRSFISKEDWYNEVQSMILYECDDEETIMIIEESYIKQSKEIYGDKCMNRNVKSTHNKCSRVKDENHEYKYECEYCGYKTDNTGHWNRHCNTKKYKKNKEEQNDSEDDDILVI